VAAALRPRVAEEGDLAAVGETLALAFEHDPVWSWAFAGVGDTVDRERKLAALAAVFGFAAASVLPAGWVRVTEGVEAVALWVAPGSPELTPEDAGRFPDLVREACGEPAATRILEAIALFDELQPREPEHWFLSMLGTHPDHAGRGHGMALLAASLEEIDAAGGPAFLETSVPALVPRYERHGFRPTREDTILAGIPSIQMWRRGGGLG
jgi:GNAT superfamily N-acetyltransferase